MDATVGSVRSPLLIGRDDLLELVDRRLDDVEAGRGQFLLIAGIAGIGKTRLLWSIGQKARDRGFTDSSGMLAPQDRDIPGGSILDFARTMAHTPTLAPAGAEVLRLLDVAPDVTLTGRRRLALDIVEAILRIPDEPTFFCFEDVQWADDLSLDVIAELARRIRDRHVVMAAAYRTDEASPGSSLRDWRSRLVTQRLAEELRLGPLSEQETALVTTLILDTGMPAPKEVAKAVYARTDGVPLYVEELLGAVGADARANGRAIRDAIVPDTIEDAVLRRLEFCSEEAQTVARAGAVIGRCFTADVLAGVMDQPEDALDAPLQELIDHFLLVPEFDSGYFDFPHQILREAIYRSVKVGDRRRYHGRAGEFGARLIGQSDIHASAHFERAGMRREAFRTALAGADETSRVSLHRESFDLYRRAVANMPEDLGSIERARILEGAFYEAYAIEENDAAADLGRQAAQAYRDAGEIVNAISVSSSVEILSRRNGRPTSAWMPSLQAMLRELEALPPSAERDEARAELLFDISAGLIDERAFKDARAALAEIRAHGQRVGDEDWTDVADWKEALIDVLEGRVDDGLPRMAIVAAKAERAGQEGTGVTAYRDTAVHAALAMEYPMATRMLDAGLRYADSIQQSYCAHLMTGGSALVLWAEGRWAEASELAAQAMTDHGCRRGAEFGRWSLAYVQMGQGQLDSATAGLLDGLAFGHSAEALEYILATRWGLAEVALQAGEHEGAIEQCGAALEVARTSGERIQLVPFVVTGVRAYLGAARPEEAATWLSACQELLAPLPDVAGAALDHGRGLLALSEGATGIARTALQAAIDGWDAKPRVWEASWARLDLASCQARSGRYADALALAIDVRATASGLASPALAARADEIARMARGRVVDDEPWRPLTAREYAVARLTAEGLTNAEIADKLGIAPKTASSHVEHILAKLGVARRAEIAAWATAVDREVSDRATRSRVPVSVGD